jgi:hypothetical protein
MTSSVAVPAQPNSTIYVSGLAASVNSRNFMSLVPEAARQDLSSHRVVQHGIAFLEYDSVAAAKSALAALRASGDALGSSVVFEYAKSKGGKAA